MKTLKITFIALFSIGLFTALASTVSVSPETTSETEIAPTDVQLATTTHKIKVHVPTNG
ncbi:hypothetical protein [Bizionia paragorgiae]|uniref:hypothetical protein n=1 Tax=Bizionia paragorgiae TaxID=283786 RepID=UPI00299CD6F5|nr:hypothetical protein [Bizionia paragorgiae]MDX1272801.1 hypothetical protein [Bizionia paragorgiae]